MSYDIHITRADDWLDSGLHPITTEEWDRIVSSDDYLIEHEDDFHWDEGRITMKNPTEDEVAECVRIAKLLEAVVQGDDGELYE